MEILIYLKALIFFLILFSSGVTIIRKLTEENRAQILLPSGAILGIALYIFLINAVAHIIKGSPGFYLSVAIEIFIAYLLKRNIPTQPMEFPKGKILILVIISLLLWLVFLYTILTTGEFGGDVGYYYSLASLFSRGDYPMHTPWQPDYIMYYHFGSSEFLGATKSITGAPYVFIHRLLALLMLTAWSQILTWVFIRKKFVSNVTSLAIISIPALVSLVSIGGFMIAWPTSFNQIHFHGSIFQWLGKLPTLNISIDSYGSPLTLDMVIYFLHRFLSISIFFCLIPIIIFPKKRHYRLLIAGIVILLSSIALVDESVFMTTLPAIFLLSFFISLQKSIPKTLLLIIITLLVVCLQGGIITQTIFAPKSNSGFLFFPKDNAPYRFQQTWSLLFKDLPNYQPFRFFHPGIIWQLSLLLLISVFFQLSISKRYFEDSNDRTKLQALFWLFSISSLTSLVAFHGIVPKLYSLNGNRFIALSYFFSGIGISFYLINWYFTSNKRFFIFRLFIAWTLLFSLVPPFFNIFPRTKYHPLMSASDPNNPSFNWVRDNLPVKDRIMVLTQPNVATIANIGLVTQIGALTPMWGLTPKVEGTFEMSPMYTDAYFTLNPDILNNLKVNYIIVGANYLPQLAIQRQEDLQNSSYFQPVFKDNQSKETIFKVTGKYFKEGKNLGGTLAELEEIAPKKGTFYIEYVPNISENMFRVLRVLLYDRDVYYPIGAAFYNGTVDVEITQHNTLLDNYDYLILGENTDPKTICHCEAKLLWTGFGNGIKLWKT